MLKIEIVFDESLIKELLMIFKQGGVSGYSLIENVKGMGHSGGRFGNAAAPGFNSLLFAVLPEDRCETLLRLIRRFKETNPACGVRVVVSEVRDFI